MPATTTTTLAALIPTELISGVLIDKMGDLSNLKGLCAVQTGFKSYEIASIAPFVAAGAVEGAALVPVAVTPVGTTINASPQEVPAIQITRLALESQQGPDWLRMSEGLGIALQNRANAQITDTFDDTYDGNRNSAQSTTGAGAPAAMSLECLELAIEIAEGNNAVGQPFSKARRLAAVLHPTQIAALRADIRGSSNYIGRNDIMSEIGGALSTEGLMFAYYDVLVYSSVGVSAAGVPAGAAGAGVRLFTGVAGAGAGAYHRGALFSVGEGVGFVQASDPDIRTQDEAMIVTGGVNLIAGMVTGAGRISEQLTLIESL